MTRSKRDGEEDVEIRASKRLRGEIVEEPMTSETHMPIVADIPEAMATEQTAAAVSAVIDAELPSHVQNMGVEGPNGPEIPEELPATEAPVEVPATEVPVEVPTNEVPVEMVTAGIPEDASSASMQGEEHPVAPTEAALSQQQTIMTQNHELVPLPSEIEHEREGVRMMAEAEAAMEAVPRAPRMMGGAGGPDDLWRQRFKELEAFKDEYGHCNVPCTYALNKNLAKWIVVQVSLSDNITVNAFCWSLWPHN